MLPAAAGRLRRCGPLPTLAAVAWCLAVCTLCCMPCATAQRPAPPRIYPTSGFRPLRVFIASDLPDNDTNTAIVFSLDSAVEQVECDSARGERSIKAPFASSVFRSSVLIRAKVCHDFLGNSDVTRQQISVRVWVGWNPVIVAWVITCLVGFVSVAFLSKLKLRGDFVTWYAALSLLPIASTTVYIMLGLDLLTIGQPNNVMFGAILLGILTLAGVIQWWLASRLLRAQLEDDRKMDWWHNHHQRTAKWLMAGCSFGIGFFTIIFSRLMDNDALHAGCDTVSLTTDLMRRMDRLSTIQWLAGDVVTLAIALHVLTRNDPEDIVPTSAVAVVIVAVVALIMNGVRVMYGFVNRAPLDPRNKSKGFVAPQGDTLFLKMQAEKEAAEKARGEAAGDGADTTDTKADAPPQKETKAQRRQRLLAEARAKRDRFNPLDYAKRHKYTKRPFPKFSDMT